MVDISRFFERLQEQDVDPDWMLKARRNSRSARNCSLGGAGAGCLIAGGLIFARTYVE
jgi:hypothetical protein